MGREVEREKEDRGGKGWKRRGRAGRVRKGKGRKGKGGEGMRGKRRGKEEYGPNFSSWIRQCIVSATAEFCSAFRTSLFIITM